MDGANFGSAIRDFRLVAAMGGWHHLH